VVAQSFVIHDTELGQLAIPVTIAGGYLASAALGVVAGRILKSSYGVPVRAFRSRANFHHGSYHTNYYDNGRW